MPDQEPRTGGVLPLVKQITDLIYQTPQGADWMATCEDAADRIVGLLNARDYEESVSGAFDPRSGLKGDGWHNARAEALIDPNDPAARDVILRAVNGLPDRAGSSLIADAVLAALRGAT
jgi:hypothetical protein